MRIKKRVSVAAISLVAVDPIAPTGVGTLSLSSPATKSVKTDPLLNQAVVAAPRADAIMVGGPATRVSMGSTNNFATGTIFEGQKVTTMARVMLPSAGALTQGTVTGDGGGTNIKLNVYDLTNAGAAIGGETSLTCSDVVYDSLQTQSAWTADSNGYNFKHTYDGSSTLAAKGATRVRFEYYIPTDEGVLYVVSVVNILRAFKS